MSILNLLKFAAINIAVFLLLLVTANWIAGKYLQKTAKANRAELPNYKADVDHAKKVFADYNRIKHRYEPFVGWRALPYAGETTNINRAGLRTHNRTQPTSDDKPVVRFFGGSTTWGEGSDDQHTIPALFNAHRPEYRVFNHGQLAYNTRQELDDLISVYARNERTDLVIFYDGVNDAAFLCPKVIEELPAHRLVPMYRDKLYVSNFATVTELAQKIFIDNIMKLIHRYTYRPTPENAPYDCTTNPAKAEAIAEMMMKNWEMAHEIVTSRHGKFIAVLQPAAFIGNPRTDHLELDTALGQNFKVIYRLLKQKIAERGHPWILDLSDKFNSDDYIFIDFCHVSPNGNAIIAREIARAVDTPEN